MKITPITRFVLILIVLCVAVMVRDYAVISMRIEPNFWLRLFSVLGLLVTLRCGYEIWKGES